MDNRTGGTNKGDNLLRKIDFNFDHSSPRTALGGALATAAPTSSNGKAATAAADATKPQVTRRIELVAIPVMPIEGRLRHATAFAEEGRLIVMTPNTADPTKLLTQSTRRHGPTTRMPATRMSPAVALFSIAKRSTAM